MTDREKIEAALRAEITSLLPQLMSGADVVRAWSPTVERLIRDAAERAWRDSFGKVGDLPPDFPLVLDAPKEAPK